jgi:hypothetical protein
MLMIPYGPPHGGNADGSHIDIPTVDRMPFWHIDQQALLIGPPINDFHLGELYPLFITGRGGNSRHHHELHELLAFSGQLSALCLLQAVF